MLIGKNDSTIIFSYSNRMKEKNRFSSHCLFWRPMEWHSKTCQTIVILITFKIDLFSISSSVWWKVYYWQLEILEVKNTRSSNLKCSTRSPLPWQGKWLWAFNYWTPFLFTLMLLNLNLVCRERCPLNIFYYAFGK